MTASNLLNLFDNAIKLDHEQKKLAKYLSSFANEIVKYIDKRKGITGYFKRHNPPNSVYIYGSVGTGKSMLTGMFYKNLPINKKLSLHFHQFMLSVHDQLKIVRNKTNNRHNKDNYLYTISTELAKKYDLIYIDELHVEDIADAMIVGQLFKNLLNNGVIIVITSNFHPDELYTHGLQREVFLQFIDLIKEKMEIFNLDNHIDYRLTKLKSLNRTFYYPLNEFSTTSINETIQIFTNGNQLYPRKIEVNGRKIICNHTYEDLAVFTFNELCQKPLGNADYLAICRHFNIIILKDIPKLSAEHRNETKRFTNLIDSLYMNKKAVICSCEVDPNSISTYNTKNSGFERTVSRLFEMQSEEYKKGVLNGINSS